eukprot:GHVU01103016.1.p1 GENE.GHVU01103016.1~~GHVU01103016.1.p1  ORF type:complete len:432 (+),score=60.39 GHVU01103016.1:339-1634(+)
MNTDDYIRSLEQIDQIARESTRGGEAVEQGNARARVESQQQPLQSLSVDEIRKICTAEGVRGTRSQGKRLGKDQLILLINSQRAESQQLAAAVAAVGGSQAVTTANTIIPPSSSSSALPPAATDSRASLQLRFLNVALSDLFRSDFLRSGDKPTRVALDQKATGSSSPFWARLTKAFNQGAPCTDFDEFIPCAEVGVHPFLRTVQIRMGPLLRSYTPEEVHAIWKALQRGYRQKHANFNQSGNHSQGADEFAKFIHRSDFGCFYLFQWVSMFPDIKDFVASTVPKCGSRQAANISNATKKRRSDSDIAAALHDGAEATRELVRAEAAQNDRNSEAQYLSALIDLQRKCVEDISTYTSQADQLDVVGADTTIVRNQCREAKKLLTSVNGRVSNIISASTSTSADDTRRSHSEASSSSSWSGASTVNHDHKYV